MNYARDEHPVGLGGVLTGMVLAIVLLAFIAFVSAAQVSSSGTGERIMSHSVAEMTEIDKSITGIQVSLRELAEQSEQDPVRVPDFPIPIDVQRSDALSFDRQQLRDEILAQSGEHMYDSGIGVWDDTDPDAVQTIGTSSTAGGIRGALGLIRATPHTIYLAFAAISGLAAAALAVAFTLHMDALRRLMVLGTVLLSAGIAGFVIVLLIRLMTGAVGDDPFGEGLSDIAVDAEGVALRNYVIVTALGAALIALGFAGSLLESRENRLNGSSFEPHA